MDVHDRSTVIHLHHPGPVPFPQGTQSNLQNFLKGEPVILGVSQITIGLMSICLWIMLIFLLLPTDFQFFRLMGSTMPYLMLLGPIFYVLSGTLSIVSGRKMTKDMVCGSLVMNTVSTVVAGASLTIFALFSLMYLFHKDMLLLKFLRGITIVQFILMALEFFIALSLSAFACHAVCCDVTSVVVDLSSNEHELSARAPYYDYDEVAFPPT